ncbi:MAG: hypothetical protein FJ267_17395, partial [Planctomycetes bacterium]|nr:hypothetical protein [Planctomycetota bacterium]
MKNDTWKSFVVGQFNILGQVLMSCHLAVMILSIFIVDCAFSSEKASITTVDHSSPKICRVTSWKDDVLQLDDPSISQVTIKDLVSLSFDRRLHRFPDGNAIVGFHSGDRLFAKPETIKNDRLRISWKPEDRLIQNDVAIENVEYLILERPTSSTEQIELFSKLKKMPMGVDIAVLKNGDLLLGEVLELDEAFLIFQLDGKSPESSKRPKKDSNQPPFKLDRNKVRAIRFNPDLSNVSTPEVRYFTLTLTDGSRLTASNMMSDGTDFQLDTKVLGSFDIHHSTVLSCQFFSDRISSIIDRKLLDTVIQPYLSQKWPVVTNANVRHGPLSIRGHV